MALGAAPDMPLRPGRELSQLLDFGVSRLRIVWQRQTRRIENSSFRAECFQQPGGFHRKKPAVGPLAQRAVKQKNPWPMRRDRWMQRHRIGQRKRVTVD